MPKTGLPIISVGSDFDYQEGAKEIFIGSDRQVREQGIDALAWYVSFHVEKAPWGIFIPISSLAYIEHRYLQSRRRSRSLKWEVAFQLLWEHEIFHFATDYAVAQWEILLQRPCWTALSNKRLKAQKFLEVEEKLANAHMLRTLEPGWPKSVRLAVRKFIQQQPAGYSEAPDFLQDERFEAELMELTKTYVGAFGHEYGLNFWTARFDYSAFFPLSPRIELGKCPIHVIQDESRLGIPQISVQFLRCIQQIIETEAFTKKLAGLPENIIRRWHKKKEMLAVGIPRHPEFEKLHGRLDGLFSIRLNDNFRAHLRPVPSSQAWEAVAVGTHKEMGHG